MLISMPFDGTLNGGRCYGAGQRRLSPGSFQKGSEKQWNQQHSRISVEKPIHKPSHYSCGFSCVPPLHWSVHFFLPFKTKKQVAFPD